MPARRRIKLEMVNEEGEKLILIFEGRISRDRIAQLADLMELYGGVQEGERYEVGGSKLAKIVRIIEARFPFTGFTTREVADAYRNEYREPIPLSTVSTYLSRLADKGYLERIAVGNVARYRVVRGAVRNRMGVEGVNDMDLGV